MNTKGIVVLYVLGDWIAAAFSWMILYWVRKELEFESYGMKAEFHFEKIYCWHWCWFRFFG